MIIRKAKKDDIDRIFEIHIQSIKHGCKGFYTKKQIDAWLADKKPEKYLDGIKKGSIFVAEIGGQVAGFVQINQGVLIRLFVDPVVQGKNIGHSLLEYAIKKSKTRKKIIKVEVTLNAKGFYKKNGFIEKGESYEKINNQKIPFIIMGRLINSKSRTDPNASK